MSDLRVIFPVAWFDNSLLMSQWGVGRMGLYTWSSWANAMLCLRLACLLLGAYMFGHDFHVQLLLAVCFKFVRGL